jgi:hypothetical protein
MFFKGFPEVSYKFGNETNSNQFQNIAVYVDLVDQLKDDKSFYNFYNILDGDRPDQLSQKLYDNPEYYWTFFLMNDHLRLRGWPLPARNLTDYVKKKYPNTTVVTMDEIFTKFVPGDNIIGLTSGTTGVILERDINLGNIVIEGVKSFINGETLQVVETPSETLTIVSSSEEYNSARFYEISEGVQTDINPGAPGAQLVEITQLGYFRRSNELLREIKVIRPGNIDDVTRAFKSSLREL